MIRAFKLSGAAAEISIASGLPRPPESCFLLSCNSSKSFVGLALVFPAVIVWSLAAFLLPASLGPASGLGL